MNINKLENVDVVDKTKCYGCTNCAVICNVGAIQIKINEDGFLQPYVDKQKCTNCSLCIDVCPALNEFGLSSIEASEVYALYSSTLPIRLLSASGGVSLSIVLKLHDEGYNVLGAVYSDDFRAVHHEVCDDVYKVLLTTGSKYVQSDLSTALKQSIQNKTEKFILFGTPCQIAGARNVLAKKHFAQDNFILVDFFCHGVPSYYLWWAFINNLKNKIGTINSLELRFKKNSWQRYYIRAFGSKRSYLKAFSDDKFGKLFLSNYCLRQSCYTCKFNKMSAADLRIGDFWGQYFSSDLMGVSISIPLNSKGYNTIVKTTDLNVQSVPNSMIYQSQGIKEGLRFNIPHNSDVVLSNLKNGKTITNIYLKYKYPSDLIHLPAKTVRRILPRRLVDLLKKLL